MVQTLSCTVRAHQSYVCQMVYTVFPTLVISVLYTVYRTAKTCQMSILSKYSNPLYMYPVNLANRSMIVGWQKLVGLVFLG